MGTKRPERPVKGEGVAKRRRVVREAEAWEDPVCSCEAEPRWEAWAKEREAEGERRNLDEEVEDSRGHA